MTTLARLRYTGYRFPAEIISHAIWLYVRFPLGLRMVEELLAARGIDSIGRVYCTGPGGIWVMAPDGRRIGVIRWPEQAVNFAFGGKKAARPRRLRQATQPRPIEQVERHGDPRKVTGSSQRSVLHAAGVPSVPGFRKICVQPATRTFTDIGAPSSIVRAARPSSPLSRFTG
jgi:hypothetical protein